MIIEGVDCSLRLKSNKIVVKEADETTHRNPMWMARRVRLREGDVDAPIIFMVAVAPKRGSVRVSPWTVDYVAK